MSRDEKTDAKAFLLTLSLDQIAQGDVNDHRKRKREPSVARPVEPATPSVVALHLRPRKLNFWDQRPEGYNKMSADQVKATGMFLLPSHLLKGTGRQDTASVPYGGNLLGYGGVESMMMVAPKLGFNTKRLVFSSLPACAEDDLIAWVNMTYEEKNWDKGSGLAGLACTVNAETGTATVEETTSALGLSNLTFMGKVIIAARPKDYRPGEEDPNYIPGVISEIVPDTVNKVFIGGLPIYVTEEQVMDLLKAFGELKSFSLIKDAASSISKGFAFCEYLNPEITELACEGLHGLELGDKKLIVQRAHTGMSKLPMIDGALPGAGLGRPILPIEILGASGLKPAEPTVVLLLLNLCDVEVLAGDEYEGIVEDVKAECERFGTVVDLHVPKPEFGKLVIGVGRAYIKFTNTEDSSKAQRALAGRKFLDRTVLTTFFDEYKYEARVLG